MSSMYSLNLRLNLPAYKDVRIRIYTSDNLDDIKNKLKEKVLSGVKAEDLSITKELEFEVKCAIAISKEEE